MVRTILKYLYFSNRFLIVRKSDYEIIEPLFSVIRHILRKRYVF